MLVWLSYNGPDHSSPPEGATSVQRRAADQSRDTTKLVAAISRLEIAVVADLSIRDHTISACSGRAVAVAPIAIDEIAVVAGLPGLCDAVATYGRFERTEGVTAVARGGAAVVACFSWVQYAVAAASPLGSTISTAAVSIRAVGIVTTLRCAAHTVTTLGTESIGQRDLSVVTLQRGEIRAGPVGRPRGRRQDELIVACTAKHGTELSRII